MVKGFFFSILFVGFKSGRTQRTANYCLAIYLFMTYIVYTYVIKHNTCEQIITARKFASNRLRTGQRRIGHMLHKWELRPDCDCGHEKQVVAYVVE